VRSDNKDYGKTFFRKGSWYHRVKYLKDDGTVKYSTKGGFKNKEDAEESYIRMEKAFREAHSAHRASVSPDMDLSDYLIYWLEEIRRPEIAESTYALTAYVVHELILPFINEGIALRNVSIEYLNKLLERASGVCESAGNKTREMLYLAFEEAKDRGAVTRNPIPSTKLYRRKKPKVEVVGKEDTRKLLNLAHDSNWYLEILLALFMGLRKGEIRGLKYSDFNLDNGTVTISRQLTYVPIINPGEMKAAEYISVEKGPKTTNSYRTMKVPSSILSEVEKRKNYRDLNKEKLGEKYYDNDYVSCQNNGLPRSVNSLNLYMERLCKRNGLPHLTVHSLRHMYATILLEQGVPLVKISALLGHGSVHTTFEFYCDVMDENEKITDFINESFKSRSGGEESG